MPYHVNTLLLPGIMYACRQLWACFMTPRTLSSAAASLNTLSFSSSRPHSSVSRRMVCQKHKCWLINPQARWASVTFKQHMPQHMRMGSSVSGQAGAGPP